MNSFDTNSAPMTGGPSAGTSLGDTSTSAGLVSDARAGRENFDFGDDRAILNPPNWHGQESTQLYQGAITNNDPGSVDSTGHAWMQHGSELDQIASDLYAAITELGGAWIGTAAGAAQGALVGIANSSGIAGEAARAMGQRMVEQASAAAEVKKMPAPAEFNADQAMGALLAGGPAAMTADMKAQSDHARDVKAQQVAYFKAYTAAMSAVDGKTPSFGPESLGLKPSGGHTGAGGAGVGFAGMSGGGAAAAGPGLSAVNSQPGLSVSGGQVGAPGSQGAAAHAAPPAQGAAPAPAGGHDGPISLTGSAPISSTSTGPGMGASAGAAALGVGLGIAGARALAKGSRSGSKKQDETTASADQSAAAPGAGAPQPQAGLSQAAAAGAMPPAVPPMGGAPVGAAAGSAQEDEEHTHNSFLIEPDPDELFGAGEATAPPVIGMVDED